MRRRVKLAPYAMPAAITYRRLDASDAAAYRAIRVEALTRDARAFHSAPSDELARPLESVAEQLSRGNMFGAFAGETLVGIAGLVRETRAKTAHKAVLVGVYVQPAFRGAGIAGQIVAHLIERARVIGVTLVVLAVIADNAEARRLYERSGFTVYGIEPKAVRVGDAYLDEAHMYRHVDAGSVA